MILWMFFHSKDVSISTSKVVMTSVSMQWNQMIYPKISVLWQKCIWSQCCRESVSYNDRPNVYAKYQDDNDSCHLAERLKCMIKGQSKLIFSESGYFDCSEIFTQDPHDSERLLLENYLHKPLFDFF